ncbi:MAG: DUF4251 domain-containing protein [Bacteroidales bacterium]|nr:DUF4251 domain-containing protein [Bacteroidales bacterium]
MKASNFTIICLMSALLMTGCGLLGSTTETAKNPQQVVNAVNNMDLNISITWIYPMGQQPRQTTNDYSLKVKNGVANTRLPFIGNKYSSSGFGEDAAIVFKDQPVTVTQKARGTKGEYLVSFTTKVENEVFIVDLTIWDDGTVNIVCKGSERTVMNYTGELRFPKEQ